MNTFITTIKTYAKENGWIMMEGSRFSSENMCGISKPTNDEFEEPIRIDLLENGLVAFRKPLFHLFNADNPLDHTVSATLLHRNSNLKGFWGMSPVKALGTTGFMVHYLRQVFLSEMDSGVFKEIVNNLEDEVEKIRSVLNLNRKPSWEMSHVNI